MGFSSAATCVGLHNLPWNFHSHRQRVFKILCSSAKDTHQSPITLELSNPNKALRASSSQIEAVQFDERSSPFEVKNEIEMCYELIRRLGRGVVYLGSARMGPGHEHYIQTQELAREVAKLLGCTSWSGAGPGLMDAATRGALEAGKPVGGFKIAKEAGEWTATNFHPYLPSHAYLTCRFFSARKHGLVDAVVRSSKVEKTGVIVLPGGIGTLDEAFEILALIQYGLTCISTVRLLCCHHLGFLESEALLLCIRNPWLNRTVQQQFNLQSIATSFQVPTFRR
ncbi:unnamed protein product [Lactuca virosa]|uniref:Cytokinin riboside 5'-monophosphate phosphoribohydrolase n=1 Tax=Lactuca virosa TaxID=75947 RepID=A0AAU9PLS9_9ASTR|nr:unnamed protein product [Lactuca virosa]